MNKTAKIITFVLAGAWNVLFFYLCGYWQQIAIGISGKIDILFGVIAIVVLAFGETSVLVQLFYRVKYHKLKKRVFDKRFIVQCVLLVFYYFCSAYFASIIIYTQSLFYLAVLAFILSAFWTKGSRVLWTGEENYYLNEGGVLFTVREISENTKEIALACSAKGQRDRTIAIAKCKE